MESGYMFHEKYVQFLEDLYLPADNQEQCVQNVQRAVAALAPEIRLGRAEIMMEASASKLRTNNERRQIVLYDQKQDVGMDAFVVQFALPDRGNINISLYPLGQTSFSEKDRQLLSLIGKQIYTQISRVMMQEILVQVTNTDMATGVANQESFMHFVISLMKQRRLDRYHVLFFNIHNFKYVNKVFPYAEGDVILRKYATYVDQRVESDGIVARLGGDNFVALVRNEHIEDYIHMLQNVRISHSTEEKKKEFVFGATLGVSALNDIETPRDVLAHASIAYQAARIRGVGTLVYYSEEIHKRLMENQTIISQFVPSLEAGEFVVYYQPKVNISDRTLCGAEALVRWIHEGRLIPPMQFVPQLEREGSICKLDYYVLEQVCKFLQERKEQGKDMICISVNFSRKHLEEDDMVERIVAIVDRYGIDHQYIEVELTESEDFQNYEIMSHVVNGLKNYGIGTSIDDFGTGFSSLNMIKKVDLNVIKIDKSFIPLQTEYPGKKKDKVMFANIVNLIRQLGKKTIAEGVETTEQLDYLREVGCDIVQGYVFDKPLPRAEFEQRLEEGYRSCISGRSCCADNGIIEER